MVTWLKSGGGLGWKSWSIQERESVGRMPRATKGGERGLSTVDPAGERPDGVAVTLTSLG